MLHIYYFFQLWINLFLFVYDCKILILQCLKLYYAWFYQQLINKLGTLQHLFSRL